MRVFLTGATGFVGSHVARHLVAEGHTLRALVRESSDTADLARLGVERAVVSLNDAQGLAAALEGCDAVVHLAGLIKSRSEAEMLEVNSRCTGILGHAAARACPDLTRFVYVSSIAAAGPGPADLRPMREQDPAHPVSVYGRSKRLGEEQLFPLADRIPLTILRPPVVYGPRDREMLKVFRMVKARLMLVRGRGAARVSLIYVEDLARAISLSLSTPHPSGSVFFVEDGQAWSWPDLGRAIGEGFGKTPRTVRVPDWTLAVAARATVAYGRLTRRAVFFTPDKLVEMRQSNWACSSNSIRETLGWRPQTRLPDGARRTADWYREAGWL
ncbi:MAG: NAD-dependent epimerase/dehydratase family protein [Myxococcota bacterium]